MKGERERKSRRRKCCSLVGIIALVALATTLLGYGPVSPAPGPSGDGLLGLSPAEVIEHFGVPEDILCSGHDVEFHYPAGDGTAKPAIRFHENCAYWVDPGFKGIDSPRPVPTGCVYLGQPVREMVKIVGSPETISRGLAGSPLSLEYGSDIEIGLIHGIVCYVETDG